MKKRDPAGVPFMDSTDWGVLIIILVASGFVGAYLVFFG